MTFDDDIIVLDEEPAIRADFEESKIKRDEGGRFSSVERRGAKSPETGAELADALKAISEDPESPARMLADLFHRGERVDPALAEAALRFARDPRSLAATRSLGSRAAERVMDSNRPGEVNVCRRLAHMLNHPLTQGVVLQELPDEVSDSLREFEDMDEDELTEVISAYGGLVRVVDRDAFLEVSGDPEVMLGQLRHFAKTLHVASSLKGDEPWPATPTLKFDRRHWDERMRDSGADPDNEGVGAFFDPDPGSSVIYANPYGTFGVNKEYTPGGDPIPEDSPNARWNGRRVESREPWHIMAHELGHFLAYHRNPEAALRMNRLSSWHRAVMYPGVPGMPEKPSAIVKAAPPEQLSVYGRSNAMEFQAEVWNRLVTGRDVALDLLEVYDASGGYMTNKMRERLNQHRGRAHAIIEHYREAS